MASSEEESIFTKVRLALRAQPRWNGLIFYDYLDHVEPACSGIRADCALSSPKRREHLVSAAQNVHTQS